MSIHTIQSLQYCFKYIRQMYHMALFTYYKQYISIYFNFQAHFCNENKTSLSATYNKSKTINPIWQSLYIITITFCSFLRIFWRPFLWRLFPRGIFSRRTFFRRAFLSAPTLTFLRCSFLSHFLHGESNTL